MGHQIVFPDGTVSQPNLSTADIARISAAFTKDNPGAELHIKGDPRAARGAAEAKFAATNPDVQNELEPTDVSDGQASKDAAAKVLGAIGHGAASGASFGLDDEAVGALNALNPWGAGQGFLGRYKMGRDSERGSLDDARTEQPGVVGLSELAGGIAVPLGAGAGLAAKGATKALGLGKAGQRVLEAERAVASAAAQGLPGKLTSGQYAARKAIELALQGGGAGVLNGLGRTEDITKPVQVAKDVATDATLGALLGTGIGLPINSVAHNVPGLTRNVVDLAREAPVVRNILKGLSERQAARKIATDEALNQAFFAAVDKGVPATTRAETPAVDDVEGALRGVRKDPQLALDADHPPVADGPSDPGSKSPSWGMAAKDPGLKVADEELKAAIKAMAQAKAGGGKATGDISPAVREAGTTGNAIDIERTFHPEAPDPTIPPSRPPPKYGPNAVVPPEMVPGIDDPTLTQTLTKPTAPGVKLGGRPPEADTKDREAIMRAMGDESAVPPPKPDRAKPKSDAPESARDREARVNAAKGEGPQPKRPSSDDNQPNIGSVEGFDPPKSKIPSRREALARTGGPEALPVETKKTPGFDDEGPPAASGTEQLRALAEKKATAASTPKLKTKEEGAAGMAEIEQHRAEMKKKHADIEQQGKDRQAAWAKEDAERATRAKAERDEETRVETKMRAAETGKREVDGDVGAAASDKHARAVARINDEAAKRDGHGFSGGDLARSVSSPPEPKSVRALAERRAKTDGARKRAPNKPGEKNPKISADDESTSPSGQRFEEQWIARNKAGEEGRKAAAAAVPLDKHVNKDMRAVLDALDAPNPLEASGLTKSAFKSAISRLHATEAITTEQRAKLLGGGGDG